MEGGGGGEIRLRLDEEEEENVEIKEEMIEEMMRCLEREINSPTTSSSDYCLQGTPFVTINGNEETCGPSFSDSASTVMASVDTRGVGSLDYLVGWPREPADVGAANGVGLWNGGSMSPETAITAAPGGAALEEEEEEDDEQWIARVVGGTGFELELEEEENFFVERV